MRKLSIFIIFFISTISCETIKTNLQENNSYDLPEITEEFLINSTWCAEKYGERIHLKFKNNGSYDIVLGGLGMTSMDVGKFKILNARTVLMNSDFNMDYELELRKSDISIYGIIYLRIIEKYTENDSFPIPKQYWEYWNRDIYIEPGSIRELNGFKIVTLKPYRINITEEVFIRRKPTVKSNYYVFVIADGNMENMSTTAYIKGEKCYYINVLGRTLEKDRIGDNEDFWYCINIYGIHPFFCAKLNRENKIHEGPIEAWIFGTFIKSVDE